MTARKLVTIDCETDPFKADRVPKPFIWGSYDGKEFLTFNNGESLIGYWGTKHVYLYAHNGGKFDFMFLLPYLEQTRVKIIGTRLVELTIGKAMLRDSFSIIPTALKDFQKTDIEYWKLEADVRHKHLREIIAYLKDDCVNLFQLVSAFHQSAGRGATIAGNALNFAKSMGLDPGKTHHRFDTVFREYYYGGRVEAFKGGKHNDINVYDINSAYPFAMSHFHGNGDFYHHGIGEDINKFSQDQLNRSFINLSCYSKGAFPVKDKYGMRFPECIGEFKITGWEYFTALKHNLISGVKIKEIFVLEDEINYKPYIDHWFNHKQKATENNDKAQRIIGKYMLNSLYGKFAQNPIHYYDYEIKASGTPVDFDNGWQLGAEFGKHEIHERPTLWRWQQKYGDDWVKFPCYYNVATAASITGFTRAHLLDAIHTVGIKNVLYCDTDCIFTKANAPTHLLRQDGKLGAWGWEGLADPCYIGGKKLYGLTFVNGPKTGENKIATKGAKLNLEQIRRICEGETIEWKNEAPTFSLGKDPSFVVRRIRATAEMP